MSAFLFDFASQADQFDPIGPPGVSYVKGDPGDGLYVDCLLYRNEQGRTVGVLYHYPVDMPFERQGNINVIVDPAVRRQGIATQLLDAARRITAINWDQQSYTDDGRALVEQYLNSKR
jgi:GNAT superfamily N-acetyltransferase